MAARFWVGGTGTWDASDTTHWASSSGGAGGQTVPGSGDTVTLDGNSGASAVITVHTNINLTSLALGTTGGNFTGTLDFATNNNSPTFSTFAFAGSCTRTLNMGSGTWTMTGTITPFDLSTATGLTLSSSSANLVFTATSSTPRTMAIAATGVTFGSVTVSANTNGGSFVIQGGASTTTTIGTLTISAPNQVFFSGSSARAYSITNAITLTGTSSNPIGLFSTSASTIPSVALGAASTGTWCAVGQLTFTTNSFTATNSLNMGAVTLSGGGSITAPSAGGSVGVSGS